MTIADRAASATDAGTIENEIEAYLLENCRTVGFLCWKFTSPGRAGVPDRVVITPWATVFVEVKRPGGRLRRLQQAIRAKMLRAGAAVYVVDSRSAVDALVAELAAD
ncbi:VRR-NUC domain-containing protein [Nocardiopsis sp. JB363]|uniref:VRR-NUC domain-containing protein n=1 Tax=Nocardiopsis sp. JB363 TaxID=1434837 RepID=UPI00097AB41A|nr:VRR-NUC domain-containing protein [Nocardiopsis sp. JB363]SIO87022.1 Phage protein [Nocardiopsis sp. JB363]